MKYSFNKLDAVTFIEEIIDGSRRSTSITYDADQRVTSIRKGSVTESYTYDGYSRVTEKVTTLSGEARLTERYTYRTVNNAPTTQVSSHQIVTDVRDITYSYTYDDNGNILSVTETFTAPGSLQSTSTTTSYVYDSQNQLLRENNEAAGKTWTWTYDNAGNILSHGEYAYTTGELGTALDTVEYGYTAAVWGDLLCTYDGVVVGCDDLGNQTYIGDRRYVWKHGRELSQLIESGTTWTYTYNTDGLRTRRTNGTTTYQYVYADGQLVKLRIGNTGLNFSYDASGTPMSVQYSGSNYYYVTNLQGDVIAITNDAGAAVVSYTYDAWGKLLAVTGTMANTLGKYNPLRYRGYVYDVETGLYYLQSRYYDPEMGRFISPDGYNATGQGFTGNNMFAYCGNSPVSNMDVSGTRYCAATSVAAESAADRSASCQWQNQIVQAKQNPEPIGKTDKGDVYIVPNGEEADEIVTFPGDVVVVDYRDHKNDEKSRVQIRNSAWITDDMIQRQVLEILDQYECSNPTKWRRNYDIDHMTMEWDAHNHIFAVSGHERVLHVDLDNGDVHTTYLGFWWRAICALF